MLPPPSKNKRTYYNEFRQSKKGKNEWMRVPPNLRIVESKWSHLQNLEMSDH